MKRPTEVAFFPCSVEAGTEDVTTVTDKDDELPFPWVYTDTLAEPAVEAVVLDWKGQLLTLGGHLEIVETSVTETTTPPDEIGVELPVETAGRELPLVKVEAEVFPEEVGTTTPPDEVGVELPVDTAGKELLLVKVDAEVFQEEVVIELTTAAAELELEAPTDNAA